MNIKLSAVIFSVGIFVVVNSSFADEYVRGYMRHDGTYVQPHYQTTPDHSIYNNYSTQGNVNPYTGRPGTVNPYPTYQTPQIVPQTAPYGMQPYGGRGYGR